MKERRLNIFFGIAVAVLAVVGLFCFFADAFGEIASLPASRGSVYHLMFGYESTPKYNAEPLLIAAFVTMIVGAVAGLIAGFLPGKLGVLGFGIAAICLAFSGIICCLGVQIFKATNPSTSPDMDKLTLGAGYICGIIFSFLPGLLCLYAGYKAFKA